MIVIIKITDQERNIPEKGSKMKNKKLLKRAKAYAESTTYPFNVTFTECPIDKEDDIWEYRYFFQYSQIYSIAEKFKTQAELNDFLKEKGF